MEKNGSRLLDKLITKTVKKGNIFNRCKVAKFGLNESELYGGVGFETEKIISFFEGDYSYLYSKITGKLILKYNYYRFSNFIYEDKYFEVDGELYKINHSDEENDMLEDDIYTSSYTLYKGNSKLIAKNVVSCKDNIIYFEGNIMKVFDTKEEA